MEIIKTHLHKLCILGLITCITIAYSSCEQKPTSINTELDSKIKRIDSLVNLYAEYEGFNGSILVARDGAVIYKNGFGLANMELEVPNTSATKFRIASVTKSFTSMLIMQLVADGKLDLHVPISTYLPDYPKKNGDQITIHQILSHTSGIVRDYKSDEKLNKYPDRKRIQDLVSEFSNLPLEFKPGDRFAYSNSGFLVLGYIIETVTEQSYETVLQGQILTPLGMDNTGIDRHRPLMKNRAKGYFKSYGDYYNADYNDMSSIAAVGNMYSTVEDMFLWDQALYNETLLPRTYLDLLFTKHIPDPDYGGYHGYAWELKEKPIGNTSGQVETIGHSGSIQGFCALFTRIPSSKSSIIFLNNTSRAFLNAMTTAITGILNDQPYDFPKKSVAKFMKKVIDDKGVVDGVLFYNKHKADPDYYLSEQELIVAGYRFLHADEPKIAASIFLLAIDAFPNADNPYDSYAEALMTQGKYKEAVKNYKKSLELNPQNNNAIERLHKLKKLMESDEC